MHLLVFGVPKINLRAELKNSCQKYGDLVSINVTNDYEVELFTECFHVAYYNIQSARIAKKKLDDSSFYGGILHVCYAPEFETLEETRAKLLQRRKDVFYKIRKDASEQFEEPYNPNQNNIVTIDPYIEENYEDVIEHIEVEDDEGVTTTSYNIKVISVQKDKNNPNDEDDITTIEVTSTQPVVKRKHNDDGDDDGSTQEVKVVKKIIRIDNDEDANRIVYRE